MSRRAMTIMAGFLGAILSIAAASACDVVPRTVLALYDGRQEGSAYQTRLHRHAAMPLNHLGYRLHYLDVSTADWFEDPVVVSGDGVAAILSWFASSPDPATIPPDWAKDYRDSCDERPARIVLGDTGLSDTNAFASLGGGVRIGIDARIIHRNEEILAGEALFLLGPGRYPAVVADDPADSMLRVRTADGPLDLIVLSDRGGYAHDSTLIAEDPRGGTSWILDPFVFFGRIMEGDGVWPVPDPTTRNGRRVYMSTVDASGWTDPLPGEGKGATAVLAGSAAMAQFITPYPDLPVTVALDPTSLDPVANPGLAERAGKDTDLLASLPNVQLGAMQSDVAVSEDGALGPERSVAIILNRSERPAGGMGNTPVLHVDPWSVDLLAPSIADLPPLTVPVGASFQVSAPLLVDTGQIAFLSLQTILERTDAPRRLAPFHLFYPVGAAGDHASRSAIAAYLKAAASGAYAPVSSLAYVHSVEGWRTARITSLGSRRWQVADRGSLQTVRFDDASEYALDIKRSQGVLGALRHGAALYVSLDPAEENAVVALAGGATANGLATLPDAPLLAQSHGSVRRMRRDTCSTEVLLEGGGGTAWWTAPDARLEVTLRENENILATDRIVADSTGYVVYDAAITLPGVVRQLNLTCGAD